MGKPARLDNPKKITLSLSAVCHEQAGELVDLLSSEPGRRTAFTVRLGVPARQPAPAA